jgi:nicotinamidase-related amidase
MSNTPHRPEPAAEGTALIVQELQNGVVGDETRFPELATAARQVGVASNVARLAQLARTSSIWVVHTTAENLPGGFGWNHNARLFPGARRAGAVNAPWTSSVQPIPEVFAEGDVVLPRFHGLSPLTGGPLDSLLRNAGVSRLVVTGVSLNIAIPNLVFDAVNRGYEVVLVTDAVAGIPVEYGEQVVRHSLALVSTLVTTDELLARWAAFPQRRQPSVSRAERDG